MRNLKTFFSHTFELKVNREESIKVKFSFPSSRRVLNSHIHVESKKCDKKNCKATFLKPLKNGKKGKEDAEMNFHFGSKFYGVWIFSFHRRSIKESESEETNLHFRLGRLRSRPMSGHCIRFSDCWFFCATGNQREFSILFAPKNTVSRHQRLRDPPERLIESAQPCIGIDVFYSWIFDFIVTISFSKLELR